jgi:SIR2-like domain
MACVSKTDYKRRLRESPPEIFYTQHLQKTPLTTLRNLLVARTFLFIGFSLDDENFGSQLKWVCKTFENSAGPHYVLVRAKDAPLLQNRLSDLKVEVIEFAEFGQPLVELVNYLISERDKIAPSFYSEQKRIRHNLPRPTTGDLIGRDKDQTILEATLTKGGVILIDGNAGVGKTTLALETARRFARESTVAGANTFDAIVWVSAKTNGVFNVWCGTSRAVDHGSSVNSQLNSSST